MGILQEATPEAVKMFVVSDSKRVFLQRQGAEDNVQRVEFGMVGARTVTGRERLGVAGGTEIY